MKRFLAIALLLMNVSLANAQAPTPLCTPGVSPTSGQPTCVPVNGANPLPISGSFSANLAGFLSNGLFATLTATNTTSASTALPVGSTTTPSVRITNNGTTVISCTMATGAATGLVSNILVQPGSSVSRVVGAFDHIACIDQTGSISNPVVIEGGSGLGNDSGGGGSGGGGGTVTQGPAGASPWLVTVNQGGNTAVVKQANTVAGTDQALVVAVGNAATPGFNTAANSSAVTAATSDVTPTNCSSTIATGNTAQNAITAGSTLHGFTLQNIDTTAENLCFNLTGTAVVNTVNSFCLAPASATAQGGSYTTPLGFGVNTNLSIIATTTGHKFSCMKW